MAEQIVPIKRVRNHIDWRHRLARLRGSAVALDLSPFDEPLDAIARASNDVGAFTAQQLLDEATSLKVAVQAGTPLRDVRHRFLALAREAAWRAIGQRPFDEQVIAALALNLGAIVEMQTGEGKTLAGVMPAALHALSGLGVHVLTFNDYLARRDAAWMKPVYGALGLSVGFVQQGMSPAERRHAYRADVTYVTAKEAGFDHLRDLLATSSATMVHRGFHVALVDEADSL